MATPITPGGANAYGSHVLGTWDTCERKGFLSFLAHHPHGGHGLKNKYPPGPVRLGGIVHESLAAYYLSGPEDPTARDVDYAVAVLEASAAAEPTSGAPLRSVTRTSLRGEDSSTTTTSSTRVTQT